MHELHYLFTIRNFIKHHQFFPWKKKHGKMKNKKINQAHSTEIKIII